MRSTETVYTGQDTTDVIRRMLPLDNAHVKSLDRPADYQEVQDIYVDQIVEARNSIFVEIRNEIGKGYDHWVIATRFFNQKRDITKEKLGE